MAFHLACPFTCQKICCCSLGTPRPIGTPEQRSSFLNSVFQLQSQFRNPALLAAGGRETVDVFVPRLCEENNVAPKVSNRTTHQENRNRGYGSTGIASTTDRTNSSYKESVSTKGRINSSFKEIVLTKDRTGSSFNQTIPTKGGRNSSFKEIVSTKGRTDSSFKDNGIGTKVPQRSASKLSKKVVSVEYDISESFTREGEFKGTDQSQVRADLRNEHYEIRSTSTMHICQLCSFGEKEGTKKAERMLTCKSCKRKYHRSCLKQWAKNRDSFNWASWLCPACVTCKVCRYVGEANKLMFCKRCDVAYHCYCLQPPYKNVPSGPFLCPKHTSCHSCGSVVPGSGVSSRWYTGYTFCDACGRLFAKGNYCPLCLKVYRDSESTPMVCCDKCQCWVHCVCDNISDETYYHFQTDSNLHYKCGTCRGDCYKVKDQDDAIQEIWRRRDENEKEDMVKLSNAVGLSPEDECAWFCPSSDDEEDYPSNAMEGLKERLKFLTNGAIQKGSKHGKQAKANYVWRKVTNSGFILKRHLKQNDIEGQSFTPNFHDLDDVESEILEGDSVESDRYKKPFNSRISHSEEFHEAKNMIPKNLVQILPLGKKIAKGGKIISNNQTSGGHIREISEAQTENLSSKLEISKPKRQALRTSSGNKNQYMEHSQLKMAFKPSNIFREECAASLEGIREHFHKEKHQPDNDEVNITRFKLRELCNVEDSLNSGKQGKRDYSIPCHFEKESDTHWQNDVSPAKWKAQKKEGINFDNMPTYANEEAGTSTIKNKKIKAIHSGHKTDKSISGIKGIEYKAPSQLTPVVIKLKRSSNKKA